MKAETQAVRSALPHESFHSGWPIRRKDGLDELGRALNEPEFASRYRLPGGQFALCMRDHQTGWAAAIRDPSATMPLHAHFDGKEWLISDSISAIEQSKGRRFALNLDWLKALHQTGRLSPDQSLYHEVQLLAPGELYLFGPGAQFYRQAVPIEWPPGISESAQDWADAGALAEHLAPIICSSVRDAAGIDSAIVQQSGGLDSNLILHAGIADGLDLGATGMIFPGMACDESAVMRRSCELAGVEYDPIEYGGRDFKGWKEEMFAKAEYPPFTTGFMAIETARHVRTRNISVTLSGMGGDEIFAMAMRSAAGFLARFHPKAALRLMTRKTIRPTMSGVARQVFSGRSGALSGFLSSRSWYFQMSLSQLLQSEGIALRLPFCDWRIVTMARPLAAAHCLASRGEERGLQRALLDHFASQASKDIGRQKANFNEIGSAFSGEPSVLGKATFPRFQGLIPAFLANKQAEGRLVN